MNTPDHKPIIGLTGAPGSGKSLVARQLERLGCGVIDADTIAKDQYRDPEVRQTLRRWWGDEVFDEAGAVDRAAVGQLVFNDPEQKRRLEGLIHPRVAAERERLEAEFAADDRLKAIVQDVPLLLEVGLDERCDAVIFVDAERSVRLDRLKKNRGWTADELDRREKNQAPLDSKRNRADYVVVNHASEAECFDQVRRVLAQILAM